MDSRTGNRIASVNSSMLQPIDSKSICTTALEEIGIRIIRGRIRAPEISRRTAILVGFTLAHCKSSNCPRIPARRHATFA